MHIADGFGGSRNILRQLMPKSLVLMVFLGLSIACAGVPEIAQAQTYRFSNVRVEGNDRVDAGTIISYAGIGQGQAVSGGELNAAYQRISNSGLFESVDLVPSGGTLVITVKEFPTINVINFEGNKRLKDEALAAIVKSQSRRVFSPAMAEADAAAITQEYQKSGRIAATVDPRIIRRSGNRVDLVFEIREGKVVEIERLSFVGNRAYSDRRLRQVLATKQAGLFRRLVGSDTFVADRIEFDKQLLSDFYLSRGYIDFQVLDAVGEVSRERDGYFVTFTVREGQSYKFANISTVSEINDVDAAEFQKVLKLRSGVTYSPTAIENNIARMENLALKKGLNFVAVNPRITRNPRTQTLDVEFVISRGPRVFVERIDIEGNTTTLDRVIRRQFKTVEGDPFNPREVRRAAERIRALDYFSDVQVNSERGSADDQVVVNVDVTEKPTGSLTFGISYGADSGVGLSIGFAENNFLGRGQTVAVDVSSGADDARGTLAFIEPAFLGRDLAFTFKLNYAETNSFNSTYDTILGSFYTGIGFSVGENSDLTVGYTYADSQIKNVAAGSSTILINEAALGSQVTSAVGYRYTYDTRTTGLNPNGGVLLRFSQDFAGLGGDIRYVKSEGLAEAERRILNDDLILRVAVEGGLVHMLKGNSRVLERYFLNGKMRGFESNGIGPRDLGDPANGLGGNIYAVARFETEFPLGLPNEYKLKGGTFIDVGSVWSLDNTAGLTVVDDSFRLRASIGVSLFWDTPVGPLRFNFSRPLKKESYDRTRNFDLTISSQF